MLTALADANVLYSNDQRNILVELAYERVIGLRWSDEIEREWVDNLVENSPSVGRDAIARTCRLMREAVPDHGAGDYFIHMGATGRTDAKDRHVAAAAIACAPCALVTWNSRDFDSDALLAKGVTVQTPDAFLCVVFDALPELTHAAVGKAYGYVRKSAGRPTWAEYLDRLAAGGVPSSLRFFAEKLRAFGPVADSWALP